MAENCHIEVIVQKVFGYAPCGTRRGGNFSTFITVKLEVVSQLFHTLLIIKERITHDV